MRTQQTGLVHYDKSRATPGFTLFSPLIYDQVYLLNMSGEVIHEWTVRGNAYGYAYLLSNGNLLASSVPDGAAENDREGLRHLVELDWNSDIVWQADAPGWHHDFCRLPNGNTAYIGFERLSDEAAKRVQGGLPGSEVNGNYILGDYFREITPEGETAWEWHCQSDMEIEKFPLEPFTSREEFAHANSIFYTQDDRYLISFRRSSIVIMIDRVTRDVVWVGNEPHWGGQHDAQILESGNLLLFANGYKTKGPALPFSQIVEMDLVTGKDVWTYVGDPPWSFNSPHISGVQRLSSGNTLICEGLWGRIFEVTPDGRIVWEYVSPYEGWISRGGGTGNWVFRALRYAADSPHIGGRLRL